MVACRLRLCSDGKGKLNTALLILEKPNVEIFKVSESYLENCVTRGTEVKYSTHVVEAMNIPILITEHQKAGWKPPLKSISLRQSRVKG